MRRPSPSPATLSGGDLAVDSEPASVATRAVCGCANGVWRRPAGATPAPPPLPETAGQGAVLPAVRLASGSCARLRITTGDPLSRVALDEATPPP